MTQIQRHTGLPLLAIVGATASGKNELAQALARRTNATLLSVDSRKVYRGLDIGTAKPSPQIIREFDYALVDCADPREYFSAGRFAREARAILEKRVLSDRPTILVGGTGFYLETLLQGLSPMPEISRETRRRVTEQSDGRGWDELYREALRIDPHFMVDVVPQDKTRIRRVLEVWWETGELLSDLRGGNRASPLPWPVLTIWPDLERAELYRRIEERVRRMREAGLTKEVEQLLREGLPPKAPGMSTVGYREIVDFLQGSMSSEDAAYGQILQNTRQYAKRQITWFRHRPHVHRLTTHPIDIQYVMELWSGQK